MSETLIPTMNLRFVEKPVPVPGTTYGVKTRVLQQMFERPKYGEGVWKDVPFVDDTGAERK